MVARFTGRLGWWELGGRDLHYRGRRRRHVKLQGPDRVLGLLRILSLAKRDPKHHLHEAGKSTAFILSTGRTGTRFLATYLNRDPETRSLHEPSPSRLLRLWTVAYLEGLVEDELMNQVLRRNRWSMVQSTREPRYVEANNFLAGFARAIIREFRDPCVIHIVRDPRTYVRSAINNGAGSGLKGAVNRYIPLAHLPLSRESPNPVLARSARYWTLVNAFLDETGRGHPRYHRFRFEELFDESGHQLSRLAAILGIDTTTSVFPSVQRRINASKGTLLPPWSGWDRQDRAILLSECDWLMQRYGYS